jgi:hypothetical protein
VCGGGCGCANFECVDGVERGPGVVGGDAHVCGDVGGAAAGGTTAAGAGEAAAGQVTARVGTTEEAEDAVAVAGGHGRGWMGRGGSSGNSEGA